MSRLKKLLTSKKVKKDKSTKISPLAYINEKCKIHPHTYIDRFCVLHNTEIESYSYVGYGCKMNNVKIGKYCSLASDIKIGLGKHPKDLLSTSPIFYSDKNPLKIRLSHKLDFDDTSRLTTIKNDVWIGANVILMDGITIENGSIIGAGSIVTKNTEPFGIYAGVPARKIGDRFEKEICEEILKSNWWNFKPEAVAEFEIYNKFRR